MNKHILLYSLVIIPNILTAQLVPTCPPGQAPAETCELACVYCDINGFTGYTGGYQGSHSVQCGCMYVDNDQWLAFVAGDTMVDITVTCLHCANNNGVQVGIFESCNSEIDCECGSQGGWDEPIHLNNIPLSPGSTYYLLIDGWANDKCNYIITVDPPAAVKANPLGTSIGPIKGPDLICAGSTAIFSVPPVTNAGTYTWTVPAGWTINGLPSPQDIDATMGGNSVKIKVGTTSGTICVTAANSCYPDGPDICKNITVGPLPVNILNTAYVCDEDKPYALPWGGNVLTDGVYQATLKSFYGCDSTVRQEVVFRAPISTTLPEITLCAGDSLSICDRKYGAAGNYTLKCPSYQGCDSTIHFSLAILAPVAEILTASTRLSCDQPAIPLQAAASTPGTAFQWKNNLDIPLSDSAQLVVNAPGWYVLTASSTSGGVSCVRSDTVFIQSDTISPQVSATGGILNCGVHQVTLQASGNVSNPEWVWSGPGLPLPAVANPVVSMAGDYIVTVTNPANGCTASAVAMVAGDLAVPSVALSGDTLTCADTTASFQVTVAPATTIFQWNGPNGFYSTVSTPVVTVPGNYLLTVTDTLNHCSTTADFDVLLNDQAPGATASVAGMISCATPQQLIHAAASSPDATFSWTGPGNFASQSADALVDQSGIYYLTVQGPNGCTSTASVAVSGDVIPPDVSAAGGTLNCGTPFIGISGSSSTPGVLFFWTGPAGFTSLAPNPLVSDTGFYLLTVTGPNACTATAAVLVSGDFMPPDLLVLTDTITCRSPLADLTAFSQTPGTGFLWQGPGGFSAASNAIAVTLEGIYSVTATAPNGCFTQQSAEVLLDIQGPGAAATGDTLRCDLPAVPLLGSTAGASVTWLWTGPDAFQSTEQNPVVDVAGVYQLQVTDTHNGCSSTATAAVIANQIPPIAAANGGTLTCSMDTLTVLGTSDVPSQFEWHTPGGNVLSGAVQEVFSPGTYALIVKALGNGCLDTVFVEIQQDIALPYVVAQGGVLDCISQQIQLTGSSATPGATFQWTGPGNFQASGANPLVAQPGSYVLTVTGLNGCTAVQTAEVLLDDDAPVFALQGADTLTCRVVALTLQSDIQSPGATGIWSGPGGFSSDSLFVTVSIPGVYTFTAVGLNGCMHSAALIINQDTLPPVAVEAQGGVLNCTVQSLALHAGAGVPAQYEWTGPGGFSSTAANPVVSEPGEYLLTVTGWDNGCSATATATVVADISTPDIAVQADSLTCKVPSVQLNAGTDTPGVLFSWTGPDNFLSTDEDPFTAVPGVYVLTVTGPNGCTAEVSYAVLQNIETPLLQAGGDTLSCAHMSGIIWSQSPVAGVEYFWVGPGGFTSDAANNSVSIPGEYIVQVTALNGCSTLLPVLVAADTLHPVVSATGGTITCLDSLAILTATADTQVEWQWAGPNQFISNEFSVVVAEPGVYSVGAIAANGCTGQSTSVVTDHRQAPDLSILPPDSLDCNTPQVSLFAQSGSGGQLIFMWMTSDGSILSGMNSPEAVAGKEGTYIVELTDLSNGCTATASAEVLVAQRMPSGLDLLTRDISCFGKISGAVTVLAVNGGTPPYTYTVDHQDFTNAGFFQGLNLGPHTLTVKDSNGCVYHQQFAIGAAVDLTLDLGPDTTLYLGQSIELTLDQAINLPDRVIETQIQPDDLELPSVVTPLHSFRYEVSIRDSAGCEVRDTRVIYVDKERRVYIPNVFNPNSSVNDRWYVSGGPDVRRIQTLRVFDRWGNLVFEVKDAAPNDPSMGWDGRYRGELLNPAVFVYYTEIQFIDGETLLLKGDVTLVR